MFDELTVAENIFMGHHARGKVRRPGGDARARPSCSGGSRRTSRRTQVKRLSVAQKHMVEIARALSHDARVVIMDEPTAALSRHEIDELFRLVEGAEGGGAGDPLHRHKFDEIFGVCDRWVCLRDGRKVGEGLTAGTTEQELVRLMVGRPIDQVFPKREIVPGPVVLTVEGLSNATEFADVGFELRKGEILGFYGLVALGRGGGDAVPVRAEPTDPGAGDAGGAGGRASPPGRGDRGGGVLRAGGPAAAGCGAAARGAGERDAGVAGRPRPAPPAVAGVGAGDDRGSAAAVDPGGLAGDAGGGALGGQPAEGGDRQVAGDAAEGGDSRRADQGNRRGLEGGGA